MLGLCEFELRQYEPALNHLRRGQALGLPAHLELTEVARYHEALVLILMQRYEQAQMLLKSLVGQDQHRDEVILAAGLAALRIPELPGALVQSADGERIGLIRQVGEAHSLAAKRKHTEACQIYESLIRRFAAASNLHYAYGALLSDLGELDEAEREFRAELKVTPASVPARIGLACLGLQTDSMPDALPLAQEAVELTPNSFMAHYLLGRLLIKAGRIEEGARRLERSRDLNSDSSRVRYALAQAYRRLQRKADALREEQAFERLRPLEESLLQSGRLPVPLFEKDPKDGKPR